jgi:hypothetical protein
VSASPSPVTADVHLWICMNPECRNYWGYFGSSAEHGKDLREEAHTNLKGEPLPRAIELSVPTARSSARGSGPRWYFRSRYLLAKRPGAEQVTRSEPN